MKILEIAENDAGQRLDKFLKKLFPQATRSLLYKLNRTGKVKICTDGIHFKKQDNEYKIQIGEKIKLFLTDTDFKQLSTQDTLISPVDKSEVFDISDIVYEDNYLLVVNKSAGVTVHPGDHKTHQISLIQQVHDYLGGRLDSLTFKPSLVHRIDRDTSGIVLIAKKKEILSKLVDDLKEHTKIKKTYYALVFGVPEKKEGTIDAKIERREDVKNQNKVRVHNNGQKALSHYKVVEQMTFDIDGKEHRVACVEVQIETGRMHQIRVHLAHIGHPILGDNTYGDKQLNYILDKKFNLPRHMLHAWKIEFYHYGLTRTIKLESRLKADMLTFMKNIGIDISHFAIAKAKPLENQILSHPEISQVSQLDTSSQTFQKNKTIRSPKKENTEKNSSKSYAPQSKKMDKNPNKKGEQRLKKQTAKTAGGNFERKAALKNKAKK